MKYRIAICDDAAADREYVAAFVRHWAEHTGNTVQINTFPSSESFLFHYADKKDYDILLLDIEMEAMDGVGHADVSTTLNIYADATRDLKKSEFASFESYWSR